MAALFLPLVIEARLKTPWGENLDKNNVWNVYPRPTMERPEWMNLNGEWDYAITPLKSSRLQSFDGKILVPFPVESQLSGVERTVGRTVSCGMPANSAFPRNGKATTCC